MTKKSTKLKVSLAAALLGAALTAGTIYAADEPAELNADSVEYSMKTGVITATGNVVMKRGTATVTGAKATYNTKTKEGMVSGGVTAVKDDMRMTSALVKSDGENHMYASGSVHAVKGDKTFDGERVDYYPDKEYILIENGGRVTSPEGVFTANHMEGWLKEDHIRGTGDAHIISPPKNLEAGGYQADYYGKEKGKAVLTGHAWAIQNNNLMKSEKLTIYLADDGNAKVQ